MIKSRNIDPASPARYVELAGPMTATTAAIVNAQPVFVWHMPARYPVNLNQLQSAAAQVSTPGAKIVDVLFYQSFVGVGGTSQALTILKNGTTIFTTAPVIALASGAAAIDTAGVLAVPTGATRGVLKTDTTILLKKGDILSFTLAVTGTYTTAPNVSFVVVVDPNPI